MLTPDGVFTFVSPGWTTLLGHPVIQVVGKPFQQFVHPDDIARCEIFLQRVIETGQRQTGVEYRVSHADGYWRWHTTNAVPLKDEAGTVVGFEGIASDITERKRAEDALKESEQKLTNIIDFLPDATFVIDRDKKVVAWNRAMEEMTGVKKEDMIGQGSYAGSVPFYGERRPYLLELIDANDKELESKYEYVQKKGNTLYAEGFTPALYGGKGAYLWATGAPLFDGRGNRIGAIESIRDITDRKLAEGELVWKTAFLEAQVEATIDGVLVVDGKGKKILANQHLLDIWKVPQHIRDDKDDTSLLQYVTSITRYPEQFLEKVVYLYAHPNETSRDEIEFKDGMVMDRYSSPVSGKDGKYYGRIWTFRDITARKRVEEKLRENEEKFSKTFHASPYAITITRPEDGKFVEVNDAFISITGFTRGEALASASIGLKLWVNEDDRQRVVADLQAGRAFVGQEFQFRAKSGEVITGLFSAQMIQLSNGPCILSSINDITERKKAEEALRESQQIIEEIINAIPVRVFWKNKNLVYLGCNAVFAHDAGFADPKDIIGKDDYQMGWRDQAELYRGDDRQVIESGCSKFLIEEPQTTPEGNTITLLTSKIPLRSSKGEISGVLGTYMDITERKRAEEALREGEQRLHSIIDGSPIPAFVIGKDHLVIHWNKALEEISSIKSEEVVGTCAHWRAFYNVERPCMADLLVDEAVELVPQWYSGKYVKSPLFEDAYEATDFFPALGENGKWLRFTAGAIRDSKGIVLAAIETLEDITVRKLAEEKYRSIFENAVMGIFQSTPDGRIISANPAFARLLGYESPEAVVNTITDMARQMYVTPERHSELLNLMNEQGTIEGHEIQFSRKDRSIIWTNMNGRAVRDNSKKLLYYEGTIQDITDRKV
ncbi:MAG: PAS domain S-box protein, partial [Deltaproteobacteria bacterium]|nr:PAS domain S-box protein [Deltaproteobacteria bacterium]